VLSTRRIVGNTSAVAGFPGGRYLGQERWWQKEGDDLGRALWAVASGLETDQSFRKNRARESLSLYEGRRLRGLHAGAYTLEAQYQEYDLNVTRSAVDTVVAEIAGRQKPMPKFQTSGGDWKTQRRAKKLEKFVVGVLHQKQGKYLNAWQLMIDVFQDAAIWGVGVAKVLFCDGRVVIERHWDHELFVDPVEARYGDPQNLFHIYLMERDKARYAFALDPSLKLSKERRAELCDIIDHADDVDPEIYGNEPRVAKMIKIVEGWRLRHPDGTPGKHAFAIYNKVLYEEEYDRDAFPFVRVTWEADRMGWHGKGLVECGEAIHRELNTNATRMQERFRLCGSKRTFVEEGSVDMEDLQANDAEVIIEYKMGRQPPQETVPKPIAEAELVWMNDVFQKFFEITGVSQMRASARKEPGVTAGVAIRTLNDMQTARFSIKAHAYEDSFVELAGRIIQACREAAQTEKVTIRWDGEIDWKDVDVPENTFDITIAPASSLPNDPAGRLQMAQELYSSGIIGVETFKQLLGWPDLEREMNNQTAQSRYIEKVLEIMLDPEDGMAMAPDPYLMNKPHALMQAAQAYFEGLYNDAPEEVLQRVRDYMDQLDQLIAAAMMPPPMPGAGMGAGPSGAPSQGPVPLAPGDGAPPLPAGHEGMRPAVAA